MEDTDSDILGLGFLITSSIMWISNRGHVFCVRGIRLHPRGVFSDVLMKKKRHDNRKTYVMLCYVMLCYVMLCYVMLCYVMLCYVMLSYVMLCSVLL